MNWSWASWALDGWTWGWIGWFLFFVVWESLTLIAGTGQELTAHLRPIFLSLPLTWFLALGLWLWIGVHLLAPTVELWLSNAAGGP